MKAGAVEFLTKPFGDDVLLSAIAGAIDRSRVALEQQAEMQPSGAATPPSAGGSGRSWPRSSPGS